jgi:hypothetical protein
MNWKNKYSEAANLVLNLEKHERWMELENVSQSLGANSEISLLFLRSVLLCA